MTNSISGIKNRIGFPSQTPNTKTVAANDQEMLMAMETMANAGSNIEPSTIISTTKMPITTIISILLN